MEASGSIPNEEDVFLDAYRGYLKGKVNDTVAYEYMRICKAYLKKVYGIHANEDERLRQAIKEFLEIPNPSTYRNTLAALKHLFKFLSMGDYLKDYKFKACMPNFDISTPSYEDVLKFRDALDNDYKFYFELGIMTAIRPEHLLRLFKRLFDKPNRMVNTWQKTFSKKNFFFSFYTEGFKPKVEAYLSTLSNNESLLFEFPLRTVQKAFVRASVKCGVHITPKTMRKFTTNHLRRHGMLAEDVDAITSHLPYSVVARHYLDHSRIKEEYDKAMNSINLGD
jgi:intergrase/recombinase